MEYPIAPSYIEGPRPEGQPPTLTVRVVEQKKTYARFAIEPLEKGFGYTLGTPLRRVLLGALPGAAITTAHIEGVLHEYTSLPHMKEDILEFLQNLKGVRLRTRTGGRLRLEVAGPGEVCAGDLMPIGDIEVVNPELHLASLDPGGRLVVDMTVEVGTGYRPAQSGDGLPIGVLPVDAIFTPVLKANIQVERIPVQEKERLLLEVWTDGSLTPQEALQKAAQVLSEHFFRLTSLPREEVPSVRLTLAPELYNTPLERLELASRTLNALKRAGFTRVGEVLEKGKADLLKIRNFGDKSFVELVNRLREKGFPLPEAWGVEEAPTPVPEPEEGLVVVEEPAEIPEAEMEEE